MEQRILVCIVLAILVLTGCRRHSSTGLRSPDPQTRCDAFHRYFNGAGEPDERDTTIQNQLYGKTTTEIHALLGDPTSVGHLEYNGVRWLEIIYRFDVCPTEASPGSHRQWKEGWRYSPSVIFRNGISVKFKAYADELKIFEYQIAPKHLTFKEGGSFP